MAQCSKCNRDQKVPASNALVQYAKLTPSYRETDLVRNRVRAVVRIYTLQALTKRTTLLNRDWVFNDRCLPSRRLAEPRRLVITLVACFSGALNYYDYYLVLILVSRLCFGVLYELALIYLRVCWACISAFYSPFIVTPFCFTFLCVNSRKWILFFRLNDFLLLLSRHFMLILCFLTLFQILHFLLPSFADFWSFPKISGFFLRC